MIRATCVVIAVLAGCVDNPDPIPPTPPPPPGCIDSLAGCRSAGTACTWCAPIGSSCSRAYVDLCAGGHGWCTEARVCRQICSPVGARCPAGTEPRFEPDDELGTDVCYCAPV